VHRFGAKHDEENTGYLLRRNADLWKVLSLPAIAQEPESYTWKTPLGRFEHHRAACDALHPERMSLQDLHQRRLEIGAYNFACEQLQSPMVRGGNIVQVGWFRRLRGEANAMLFRFRLPFKLGPVKPRQLRRA
jgi:hypothetical protein